MTTIRCNGRASVLASRVLVAAALCALAAALPSFAAQNCISNGDFESPVANYNHNTGYSYNSESGNGGKPTGWTLSPANHTGRVNEGTTRFGLLDLMGKYSMFLERRKADTAGTFTEAKQSFSVPAPGKYRLSLNCCNWAPENTYAHLNAFAQLIQPGGVVTNALKNFKPVSFDYGLEGIRSFAVDTETLTTYGAGNNYTLRFYATDKPSLDYAYNVIDNVNFSLRTLVLGVNETFATTFGLEPHDMELGADSTLTYAPTTATTEILGGKVTFATGAKLIFDMASASADAYVMRTGGIVLPEGESDPLDFIELANAGDYALSLIEDDKTVLIAKASAPVSVTWTGAGDPSSLLDADNWSAVPNASTLTITLGATADWRGLGTLAASPIATIDMNGNALTLSGLSSAEFTGAAITNSASGAAAVLTVDVAAGTTNENKTVAILGNVRLVKEGVGGFKASKIGQTYWGGTAVNGGTLIAGTHGKFRPFGAGKNLIANADFEANGLPDTWSYRYTSAIPGTEIVGWTPSATSYTGLVNAYFYWTQYQTVANDPQYEWYGYALFFSNNRAAWQTFHVDEPGTYRFVFEYGPWIDTATYDRPPTTVTISGVGETNLTAVVTPVAEVGYRQFFADVTIASAGDYTLRFDTIGITGNRYIAFDNVSFAPKCEIAIGSGTTLDMNGHEGYGMYSITVAGGGTLMNSGSEMTSEKIGFADVTFADNHVLQLEKIYPISGFQAAMASFDLGGKTNSVAIPAGKNFSIRDAEIENGTFNVLSGGWLQIDGNGVDASTADVIVGSAFRANAPLTVRNYTARYNANYNDGTATLNVLGTFTPENAYFYGCTMQDGSTIDLSAKSAAWSTSSSFTAGKRVVDFAPDATVNIEVGDRELTIGDQVVSWTTKPPVEDNVLFELVRNGVVSETQAFSVQTNGLFVKRAAEPAYATWDVGADKWKFYTATDAEISDWEEGVTGNMQVRFSSYEEYVAIAVANVTPSAFVMAGDFTLPAGDGELAMTAIQFEFPAGATIDLNGRALKLSEAMIGGTRPFTVTSSVAGGVLVADIAGTANNTAMTLTGYTKLLKIGAGTLTATKSGQTYIGGTEVTNGVLKCGTVGNNNPFGPMQAPTELVDNGDFDADTSASWNAAPKDWSRTSDGNWVGRLAAGTKSYVESALPVGKYVAVIGSKGNPSKASSLQQNINIPCPGKYRLTFKHATYSTGAGNTTDVLLIRDGVETKITEATPTTTTEFETFDGDVFITEAGTYTLMFRNRTTTAARWNLFDDVSLMLCKPEVRASGADAVIDMNGQIYHYYYDYVLDGAVLKNTATDRTTANSLIRYFSLDDDSTLQLDRSYGFFGDGYRRGDIRLGGHTLAVNIASGKTFMLVNMTFDEGRVEIPVTTGKLYTGKSGTADANHEIAATNVDFSVGCALNLYAPMDVRGYEALYEGSENVGTQPLNVFGTFRPVTSNYYGCVLQDGSTLDLSGWTGAWPWSTTSAFTTGNRIVTFADGATVTVRRGAKGGKIVSWNEKPSNFDTLTFVRDPSDTRKYKLVKKDDGVYVEHGFMLIVR